MKRSRVSLEDLKTEFISKEFGWLTVIDVIHDKLYKCICKCRCGREKIVDIYKLRSGHTSSCGCYSKSKEFADSQSQYLKDHPEITASSLEKYLEWRRSNQEEVALTNEKHKQWFKDNPDKVKEQARRYSQWCKDNPDKIKEKSEKYLQWCRDNNDFIIEKGKRHSQWHRDHKQEFSNARKQSFIDHPENRFFLRDYLNDHPEIRLESGKKHSKWYKDNPDKAKKIGENISQWAKDNPDKIKERSEKISEFYKNNPEAVKSLSKKCSQWCKEHPEEIKKRAEDYSVWYSNNPDKTSQMKEHRANTLKDNPDIMHKVSDKLKQRYIDNPNERKALSDRVNKWYDENTDHSYLEKFRDIIHEDDYSYSLSHPVKSIRTKCPVCNEYHYHLFTNVFVNSRQNLKYGHVPMCEDCRCSLTSSYAEQEVADYISTFYSGECIRNARNIIYPLELDLYYPEKKIAIEFNGDYWHSEKFKDSEYHRSKYIKCCENDIHLISVFEHDWLNNKSFVKDAIMRAFNDQFNITNNDISDKVSLDCDYCNMNDYLKNGYTLESFDDSYYNFNGLKVYRTGVANLIKLS